MPPLPSAARFAVLSFSESEIGDFLAPSRDALFDQANVCCCGLIENPSLLSTAGIHDFALTDDVLVHVLEQEHACCILVRAFAMLVESRTLCLTCQSGRHRSGTIAAVLADWSSRLLGPTLLQQSFTMHGKTTLAAAIEDCTDFVKPASECQDSHPHRSVLLNGSQTQLPSTASFSETMIQLVTHNPWAYFAELDAVPMAARPRGIDVLPLLRLDAARDRLASSWHKCCRIAATTVGSFRHMALQACVWPSSPMHSWPPPAHHPPRPPAPPRANTFCPTNSSHPLPAPRSAPLPDVRAELPQPRATPHRSSPSRSRTTMPLSSCTRHNLPARSRSRRRHRRPSADRGARSGRHRSLSNAVGALPMSRTRSRSRAAITALESLQGHYRAYSKDRSHLSRDELDAMFCSDHASEVMTLGDVSIDLQALFMSLLRRAPDNSERKDDLVWLLRRQWGSLTGDRAHRHIANPSGWFRAALAKFKNAS